MPKILLVEDDLRLAGALAETLANAGYSVESAATNSEAQYMVTQFAYDLIVLDWELPDREGISVCAQYRATGGNAPVLMLTGRSSIEHKEIGFDLGVDDYVTKPFNVRELLMRIRALLRRPGNFTGETIQLRRISIDMKCRLVFMDNEEVKLQPIEFDMLLFFFRHPDQVFSPEQLLNHCWPASAGVSTESVYACIRRLRRKLDSVSNNSCSIITTVHGAGYRLDSRISEKAA